MISVALFLKVDIAGLITIIKFIWTTKVQPKFCKLNLAFFKKVFRIVNSRVINIDNILLV